MCTLRPCMIFVASSSVCVHCICVLGMCCVIQVTGVSNCQPLSESEGFSIRHEPIGFDRHLRRYWFLARRLIV